MKKMVKDAVNLAAPHTWSASVMPCVLALAISYKQTGTIRPDMALCLFVIAVLMQSSVNALNDYADFVKGTDTLDNSPDPTDAVIVYGLKPETAKRLGLGYLLAAFLAGVYVVWRCGAIPLVIGLIGALVIFAYSSGKTPISYLPLGELVSGLVMGGLITLAGVYMQTGLLRLAVLADAGFELSARELMDAVQATCDGEMIQLNLSNIQVSRRMRELLVLRVNGFSMRQVVGYLIRETVLTTGIGIVLGVLLGVPFASFIVRKVEVSHIMFVRTPFALAWVIAAVLCALFSLTINAIAFRRIRDVPLTNLSR